MNPWGPVDPPAQLDERLGDPDGARDPDAAGLDRLRDQRELRQPPSQHGVGGGHGAAVLAQPAGGRRRILEPVQPTVLHVGDPRHRREPQLVADREDRLGIGQRLRRVELRRVDLRHRRGRCLQRGDLRRDRDRPVADGGAPARLRLPPR
jgi:hypothetical protein